MRTVLLFVALISFQINYAQKVVKKSIVDPDTSLIQIDATNCFQINLSTVDTDEVVIEATIDGEYRTDLLLSVQKKGGTLEIGTGFQPNFKNPNDKLSAHKVVSIALDIKLPFDQTVQVFGTNSNVDVVGAYKNLKVTLDDGHCHLYDIMTAAEIQTASGTIVVQSSSGFFEATSKYGTIKKENIPKGENRFILTSTTGDIEIRKTD
ncbi:hypothetical protein ACEZ3G_07380 [Maribacter algicola]|uniref:Uncharacterized protein n=1 Tax=Meishania litoralis TaxID=3434685 RepID=A0ACC7LHY3_9FLAO